MKASLIRLIAQMICGGYVCSMAEYRNDTERTVGRKTRGRWLASAVGLALTATACSGGSNSAAVPTVQLTSTAPTTVATTTTIQATTTTEDPALAYERDVAEITAVYRLYVGALEAHGLNLDSLKLERFASGALLGTMTENITAWHQQGFTVGTTASDFDITELSIDDDSASLTTCELDGVSIHTADGQVVIPADTERGIWVSELQRFEQGWRITESGYLNGELTPCA